MRLPTLAEVQEISGDLSVLFYRLRDRAAVSVGTLPGADLGERINQAQTGVAALADLYAEVCALNAVVARARDHADTDECIVEIAAALAVQILDKLPSKFTDLLDLNIDEDEEGLVPHTSFRAFAKAWGKPILLRHIGRAAMGTYDAGNGCLTPSAGIFDPTFKHCPTGDAQTMATLVEALQKFAGEHLPPDKLTKLFETDGDVPDEVISGVAELGVFGMSINPEYGGSGMSYKDVVTVTTLLSEVSLGALGSLATRPEIFARGVEAFGTEEQKKKWLPLLASGEVIAGIGLTEADTGSDLASADDLKGEILPDGRIRLQGGKMWLTLAGKATALFCLVRFPNGQGIVIVEKKAFDGHSFEFSGAEANDMIGDGSLTGSAIPTLGYRNMHSFRVNFDDVMVPAENLIGGPNGVGEGLKAALMGLAAGRLQTAGRGLGVIRSLVLEAIDYAGQRKQFKQTDSSGAKRKVPIFNYQRTEHRIGWAVVQMVATRCLAYDAADFMDSHIAGVDVKAKQRLDGFASSAAKLFASRAAPQVAEELRLILGAMSYSTETSFARKHMDALVLRIFEGVEFVLQLPVLGVALLQNKVVLLPTRAQLGLAA